MACKAPHPVRMPSHLGHATSTHAKCALHPYYYARGVIMELATVLAESLKAIIEKVESGKRLAPEELMLLMLDLVYSEVRG